MEHGEIEKELRFFFDKKLPFVRMTLNLQILQSTMYEIFAFDHQKKSSKMDQTKSAVT